MLGQLPGKRFCVLILVFSSSCHLFAYNILWDTSHGAFTPDYIPSTSGGFYQSLSVDLQSNNFNIQTTSLGFDQEDFTGIDVAVINAATSKSDLYDTAEINALKSFVAGGGGLLVMADRDPFFLYSYQSVLGEFGVTLGSVIAPGLVVDDFSDHPVFSGIDSLSMYYAIQLNPSYPSQAIASYTADDTTSTFAVSLVHGQGRVLVLGDTDMWTVKTTDYYHQAHNQQFAINTFEHLVDTEYIPEPATMILFAAGAIMLRRKGKH